jgi:hypothetical protein
MTAEESRVAAESDKRQRDTQLFSTLLASKPARARSPLALGLSVAVHVIALGLLVLTSRAFVPRLAHKLFEQITIMVPAEEDQLVTLEPTPVRPGPALPKPKKDVVPPRAQPGQGAPLTFTPGPIAPISAPTPGPETVEPSDNGVGNGAPATLADRLRAQPIDPRISAGGSFVLPDLSPAAAVRARIGRTLQAYNDSVAAEADARRRALDWTIKGKDGKSWGIGPDGRIHLGDITLPTVAFSAPPGKRDEINGRNRDFAEIELQANHEIARQTFKDRVKAIRARKDKEREEKKKTTESTPITN